MTAEMQRFESGATWLVWRGDGETIRVESWGADSVRVRATMSSTIIDTDYALLPPPECETSITVAGDVARLVNGRITVVMTTTDGYDVQAGYSVSLCEIEFQDRDGSVLLRERRRGGALKLKARDFRAIRGGAHHITATFESHPDEKLFGMGQYQQAEFDLKGCTFELAHRNSQTSVPFVLSSAGYGFLWHNPAIGRATLATNGTEWVAESSLQLDYWITAGTTPRQIMAAYADATGHVPMMPEYGLGYWQCKLRYWNQEQLLEVAREHKRRDLPLDVIVADFFHWPRMGDYRFEDEFWPDPEGMTEELTRLGIRLMVSVWPQISVESENFESLQRGNLLVRAERGPNIQMSFEGPSMFIDTTNPGARAVLWDLCKRNYYDKGATLFWLDEAEPEYGVYDFDNYRYHAGPNIQIGNIYPQTFSRAFFDGMRAEGRTEIVNLVRSAWAGSQRYGALVWSGDIGSTWEDFRHQISAGIHMGIAGMPWFTTDIGGFHGGRVDDPEFHELLIRWFQFATFCPVLRMHGDRQPTHRISSSDGTRRADSGAGNELWSFGDDVYEILANHVHLRETMRPYVRRAMAEAHADGQPVLRALFHEFPADEQCWRAHDQYLFGADLLVAPIVEPGRRQREVYLPAGASWTNITSGETFEGGRHVSADAPLDVIPVFSRNGSFSQILDRSASAR